jgi:glucose-1-phosphate cytidylyltransferase
MLAHRDLRGSERWARGRGSEECFDSLAPVKAVILAGGLGSRLSEETSTRPKPMVEIGGKPMLWHIMKIYAAHGIDDFVICLGYKGYMIKEFFANYYLHTADVTFDLAAGSTEIHRSTTEPWRVTLVETGEDTMTGGRLRRVLPYLGDEDFCFTYGDGVANIDIRALIAFHEQQGRDATITAVQPPGRFGALDIEGDMVNHFEEKPRGDGLATNGGFFVLKPNVGRFLAEDSTVWEQEPVRALAEEGQMACYRHEGFWQPMDTLRDRQVLQELWDSGSPPWRTWEP